MRDFNLIKHKKEYWHFKYVSEIYHSCANSSSVITAWFINKTKTKKEISHFDMSKKFKTIKNKEKQFEIQKEWKLWGNIYYIGFIGWYIGKYVLQKTIELIK